MNYPPMWLWCLTFGAACLVLVVGHPTLPHDWLVDVVRALLR